jgi:dTMP kinase
MSGRPGLFISLEGGEGSGKSTQMRTLVERLRRDGYLVTENQEPGGTAIGNQIRRILLDPTNYHIVPRTELLLMFASRAQAAFEVILPALERGEIVVSDRFTDSTLAYQGAARGLGFELVAEAHRLSVGDLMPDLTLCLIIDVETGLARARARNRISAQENESRIDRQSLEFHARVASAYCRIAEAEPQRVRLIDAHGEPEEVFQRIWSEVEPVLARHMRGRAF